VEPPETAPAGAATRTARTAANSVDLVSTPRA
jgi:hypothetical protein